MARVRTAINGAGQKAETAAGTIGGMRGEGIEETTGVGTIAAMSAIATVVAGINNGRSPDAANGRPRVLYR